MVIAAALALLLAACSGGDKKPAASAGGGAKDGRRLSDGKTTFSVFIAGLNERVSSYDYKDNLFTKKIVDETGINLEIIASSFADAPERLNVMLNTGDYPDLIMYSLSGNLFR
jgi:putative aldouronate transport system substrate-binding protein